MNVSAKFLCVIAFGLIALLVLTHAQLYAAVTELGTLIKTHRHVVKTLDKYISSERDRLYTLKKYLERYQREDKLLTPNYLGNPINSYRFIKMLTIDVEDIERKMNQVTGYKRNATLTYPERGEVDGAAQALKRLEYTYDLNITDLSNGVLKGVYSTPLTSSDCYEIGKVMYKDADYRRGIDWLKAALKKYRRKKRELYSFKLEDIYEHISFGYHSVEDYENALKWLKKLLELVPGDPHYVEHVKSVDFYERAIIVQDLENKTKQYHGNGTKKAERPQNKISRGKKLLIAYKKLCRGDMGISETIIKRLKCWYLTETHPFFRLAPIKMEQLYTRPDVFMLYDVISNREVDNIKYRARRKLARGRIIVDRSAANFSNLRITKVAWINDKESQVVTQLSHRISTFSGLTTDSAEDLQVAIYGLAGHYVPHYDFCLNCTQYMNEKYRIATVLFYISHVTEGGATVFPELGLAVKPVRRAALFWWNLHPSGEQDEATFHGACPVLLGTKWVANKWLSSKGQEFRRPCTLRYQKRGIHYKILPPVLKF